MNIGWHFPSNNSGTHDGFNDAGIETFTGAPFDGLAREIIQNSLDAATTVGDKVTVEFDYQTIDRNEFPAVDDLTQIMQKCLTESQTDKENAFFENAVNVLREQKIPCLKISDFGTTGLRGGYTPRSGQWHALTKARAVSDKSASTAGGSYGLGKHAAFVVSALRTVFYSTQFEENGKNVYRAQGKSILMSHLAKDDDYTQGTGFYGEIDGLLPIENDIPKILYPREQGCVVFVPGFAIHPQWQHEIMAATVANFFFAIDQGKLEVLIQDDAGEVAQVSKENLEELFQKLVALNIGGEKVANSLHYYRTIKEAAERDSERPLLGHCRMWVLAEEGLPKSVALIRKTGMLITDDQLGLKRWAGRMDFAGVFICDSDKGNRLLRDMENPKHDAFEPERAIPDNRKKCTKALNEMVQWIKACVDELAKPPESATEKIDELAEFFPDLDDTESTPGDSGERDPDGRPVYQPKPLKRTRQQSVDDGDGDEGGANTEHGQGGGGDGVTDGEGDGEGTGGTGPRSKFKRVDVSDVRIVLSPHDSKRKSLHFTPKVGGDIVLELAVMGDDGSSAKIDMIDVACDATKVANKNGCAELNVASGKRISLQVGVAEATDDSLTIRAFTKIDKTTSNANPA